VFRASCFFCQLNITPLGNNPCSATRAFPYCHFSPPSLFSPAPPTEFAIFNVLPQVVFCPPRGNIILHSPAEGTIASPPPLHHPEAPASALPMPATRSLDVFQPPEKVLKFLPFLGRNPRLPFPCPPSPHPYLLLIITQILKIVKSLGMMKFCGVFAFWGTGLGSWFTLGFFFLLRLRALPASLAFSSLHPQGSGESRVQACALP